MEPNSPHGCSDRTVTSPVGDVIEVLTRADIATLLGHEPDSLPMRATMHLSRQQRGVLAALWNAGTVENSSGRATMILQERAAEYEPAIARSPNISNGLSAPIMGLLVDRKVKGKRTYAVRLQAIPGEWIEAISHARPALVAVEEEPVEVEATEPPPPPHPATFTPEHPHAETRIADAVATSLIAQVVAIITARNGDAPQVHKLSDTVEALERRLGEQTGYVERLRRDLRNASDEITALQHERDGLRMRLREAEHNLKVATSADAQRIIDSEVRKQLDKLMRQKPESPKAEAS